MSQISAKDYQYFNGSNAKIETESSVLVSSSPYLNHPMLRHLIGQEMLRRRGPDVTATAFLPEVAACFQEIEDTPYVEGLFQHERESNPEFAAWLDARHLTNFTADDVRDCKEGTLGGVIFDFIANSGFKLDYFFQGMEIKTDYDYYKKQRVLTHDIEHMVTGFETDSVGEHALIYANFVSFYEYFSPELACELTRFYSYLESKALFRNNLFYPEVMPTLFDGIQAGIAQGRSWKKPLVLVNWRDHLDWTIPQFREEYGIVGCPEPGLWSWTTEAVGD